MRCESAPKAIPTRYKGYQFRSRLEARWAVFFDALGIKWVYEPERFEREIDGSLIDYDETKKRVVRYLPDFYLSDLDLWVEVKGASDAFAAEAERMTDILDWGSPIPGFENSFSSPSTHPSGLLILGPIPEPSGGITMHPIIQHYKGLVWRWARFTRSTVWVNDPLGPLKLFGRPGREEMDCRVFTIKSIGRLPEPECWFTRWTAPVGDPPEWGVESKNLQVPFPPFSNTGVSEAYAAARSARFEHGESGRT